MEEKFDISKISDLITQESRKKWIPLSKCKDGYLYYIHARNSNAGIFCAVEKGFIISRHKRGQNFLFTEYHWEVEFPDEAIPMKGTVKPLREIEKAPEFDSLEDKLQWLNRKKEFLPDPWLDKESL